MKKIQLFLPEKDLQKINLLITSQKNKKKYSTSLVISALVFYYIEIVGNTEFCYDDNDPSFETIKDIINSNDFKDRYHPERV